MRRVWRGLRRWHQANPIGLAAAHARHHYDISTELNCSSTTRCNIPAPIFAIPSMKR
jgi:hypothetical protein